MSVARRGTGGITQLRDWVQRVRPREVGEPVVRFETAPALQAHVDFAECRFPWGKRFALLAQMEAAAIARRLARYDRVLSSPLLEAELFSALRREERDVTTEWSSAIEYVIVDRPLTGELTRVLHAGYVRGADCWHLATALFVAPDPSQLAFITLDETQRKVAKALGFRT